MQVSKSLTVSKSF